jgi:hypothetical protein
MKHDAVQGWKIRAPGKEGSHQGSHGLCRDVQTPDFVIEKRQVMIGRN